MLNRVTEVLLDNIVSVGEWMYTFSKKNAVDFCELETADDEITFVGGDGSLMTMLRVDGINCLPGKEEAINVFSRMTENIQAYLARPGHTIQMVFMRDPEIVRDDIAKMQMAAASTAQRLGMNVDDILREREGNLAKYTSHEETLICLWTSPGTLTPNELNTQRAEQLKFFTDGKAPHLTDAQYVAAVIPALRDKHSSFVNAMVGDLESSMLSITVLDVHTAGRLIRHTFDPDFTSSDWNPVLPGDKFMPRRLQGLPAGDISDVMWPPLRPQLVSRDVVTQSIKTCRVGDRVYQPMYMDVYPKPGAAFMTLFRRIPKAVPWRISFILKPDGLGQLSKKTLFSTYLSWTHLDNKLINAAKTELEEAQAEGEINVEFRIAFTSWAPAGKEQLLGERSSILARAIQGWNDSTPREVTGDACAGLFSTLPGMSTSSIANVAAAPIGEAVQMLPLLRPMLPWQAGAVLFRSIDGRLMPYQPGSPLQVAWVDLTFAKPGSGKSVTMNAINLALCLAPGIMRLPRIAIIDVAPSSSGLISVLKESLPEGQKHLAVYHKLRMTREYSVNPFDTQLGCRKPTPLERAFMVNFLTLLATPVSKEHAYDGVAEMCGMLIDEAYKHLSGPQSRMYSPGICSEVDELLPTISLKIDRKTTWWEIVDGLFEAGRIHEASMAQRYAVPLLSDMVEMCGIQQVRDLYGSKLVDGEPLIEAMQRMLSSAAREYPVLSQPTVFDLGDARIISLDLNDVAKGGGDAADRQTAVMYMLARHITANKFFLSLDDVSEMPALYRNYQRAQIDGIREDVKRICFDEFHKTEKAPIVREQVEKDIREGRKFNIHISLTSQLLKDFTPSMLENATSVFIMGVGQQQGADEVAAAFGLNASAKNALQRAVNGPKDDGVSFIAKFSTKGGSNIQLLTLTLGPIELWALDSTVENVMLRNMLYERIGPGPARLLLAKRYPRGAQKEIERRRLAAKDSGDLTEEAEVGAIVQVFNELADEYSRNPDQYR